METLRKSIAVFCAITFIFAGVAALFLFNFDQRAFTAETYQQAFAREDFYNKLPAIMADSMVSSGADQNQFPIQYDLELDTSNLTTEECAEQVIERLKYPPTVFKGLKT